MWPQCLGLTFLESKLCGSPPPAIQHGKHWWEQPPVITENSYKLNQQILQLWTWNILKLTGDWQTCFRVASAAAQWGVRWNSQHIPDQEESFGMATKLCLIVCKYKFQCNDSNYASVTYLLMMLIASKE